MRKIALSVCVSATILLTGCGYEYRTQLVMGTIIDKEYVEPYKTTTFVTSAKVLIPVTHNHPERHEVLNSCK